MIALCGSFVPVPSLPPALQAVARVLPLTYAVSLLQGIWKGEAWSAGCFPGQDFQSFHPLGDQVFDLEDLTYSTAAELGNDL